MIRREEYLPCMNDSRFNSLLLFTDFKTFFQAAFVNIYMLKRAQKELSVMTIKGAVIKIFKFLQFLLLKVQNECIRTVVHQGKKQLSTPKDRNTLSPCN